MSDEEFDEESYRAYENELYGEKSSDSEEGIASEIEDALYSQVHYSFSLPNEEELDEKGYDDEDDNNNDVDGDSSDGNQELLDSKQQDNKEVQDDLNKEEDSAEKIDYIVIDEESCSNSGNSNDGNNQEDKSDDDDDGDDDDDDDDDVTSSKATESIQENWSLIEEDLRGDILADGKRRPVSRYYKKEANFRCHNCNEKGHKAVDCPTPKKISCFLCGGEHMRKRCPNELCFNCHEPGHRVMNCKKPRSRPNDQCRRCFMLGHFSKDCPDRWRQYHRTTDAKKQPVANRTGEFTGPVYCYNCSEQGHYGHECISDRMDNYLSPTYPFVVKYDGDPDHHQHDKHRKRTQTHDGTVSQFQEGTSQRASKRQRRIERQSWPKQRHDIDKSRGEEEIEETKIHDGRVGQFIERISERTKKRQRGKNKRKSWHSQSHDHEHSRREEYIEEGFDYRGETNVNDGRANQLVERISERTNKRQREKDKRKSWHGQSRDYEQSSRTQQGIDEDIILLDSPRPHDQKGSTSGNFGNDQVRIGSKRRHNDTPYHDESKKGKQAEHKINKQKKERKKEKYSQSTSHNERIVEIVHDDEVYGNEYRTSQQEKTKNKKFNKRREEMNTSHHHHSSPAYDRRQSHSSPAYYNRHQSHSSPAYDHHESSSPHSQNKKVRDDKRSSHEYNGKLFITTTRGFQSKWK